ncbi:MAG: VOC family protein [Woeseia sp.]
MNSMQPYGLRLTQHTLRIADPAISLPFYEQTLGMMLLAERRDGDRTLFFLGYADPAAAGAGFNPFRPPSTVPCLLTLVHNPKQPLADVRRQPDSAEGYWKISLSVEDVDIAHNRLVARGVEIDSPRQVPDIAYLCHLYDPDGYCIELIQHDFQHRHEPAEEDPDCALGTPATFSLITCRAKDINKSLEFYAGFLGMQLLSRQVVGSRGFTLYFLAFTDERPPYEDIEHIENREWLWKRPYTLLELQHIWGTEDNPGFAYRVGAATGFEGISLCATGFDAVLARADACGYTYGVLDKEVLPDARVANLVDPDSYSVKLVDFGS